MTRPTRQSKRKASRRGEVRARLMFAVTGKESCELYPTKKDAEFHQQMNEDLDEKPYMIEPVFSLPADEASVKEMIEQVARALAPLAFHEYKQGECLPRGHEMDTVERVNEMQEWRRRSAYSDARKTLRALNLTPTKP